MTWKNFHDRGAVLRDVLVAADTRRDGVLPMDVPGVAETFGDELSLLGALQLRWHTRLAARVERGLDADDHDLAASAWRTTAEELPGVRAIIDHYSEHPSDERMARATAVAAAKERALLGSRWGTLVA
jgi:hypothetical protein